jgi:hypothetical protein
MIEISHKFFVRSGLFRINQKARFLLFVKKKQPTIDAEKAWTNYLKSYKTQKN